jgi:CheY-specific phosphatase CheX
MTSASNRPDLRRIGERSFTEVLGTFLSLPATPGDASNLPPVSVAPEQITSTVLLEGRQVSGAVHVRLPQAFVAEAIRSLTGLDGAATVLEDAAGELANMVAGRVAKQLEAHGYPCNLGTPSVSRRAPVPTEPEPRDDHGQADLFCNGHWLSLELRCRYVDL